MNETYLDMLEDSLRKKREVLKSLYKDCELQRDILKAEDTLDETGFDDAVARKGDLIRQLEELNDGFADIYDRVRIELEQDKHKYRDRIGRMQELIREVTDLGNSVEAIERRNKKLAENYFSNRRQDINRNRKTNQAALDYYLNMNNSRITPPQFYDRKN